MHRAEPGSAAPSRHAASRESSVPTPGRRGVRAPSASRRLQIGAPSFAPVTWSLPSRVGAPPSDSGPDTSKLRMAPRRAAPLPNLRSPSSRQLERISPTSRRHPATRASRDLTCLDAARRFWLRVQAQNDPKGQPPLQVLAPEPRPASSPTPCSPSPDHPARPLPERTSPSPTVRRLSEPTTTPTTAAASASERPRSPPRTPPHAARESSPSLAPASRSPIPPTAPERRLLEGPGRRRAARFAVSRSLSPHPNDPPPFALDRLESQPAQSRPHARAESNPASNLIRSPTPTPAHANTALPSSRDNSALLGPDPRPRAPPRSATRGARPRREAEAARCPCRPCAPRSSAARRKALLNAPEAHGSRACRSTSMLLSACWSAPNRPLERPRPPQTFSIDLRDLEPSTPALPVAGAPPGPFRNHGSSIRIPTP